MAVIFRREARGLFEVPFLVGSFVFVYDDHRVTYVLAVDDGVFDVYRARPLPQLREDVLREPLPGPPSCDAFQAADAFRRSRARRR